MKLDEIVRRTVRLISISMRERELQKEGFDYALSVEIAAGNYSLDFLIEENATIQLVLEEYVKNAFKAIYGTDGLSYIKQLKSIPARIIVRLEETDESYVLSVTDNGKGITPENRGRIFREKFSTRGTTGIGLIDVYTKVKRNLNGTVNFDSEVGKGSTFRLYLRK